MGIATQGANGEFLQLTEIASNFAEAFGDSYTDVLVMFNVGHQLLNTTGIG